MNTYKLHSMSADIDERKIESDNIQEVIDYASNFEADIYIYDVITNTYLQIWSPEAGLIDLTEYDDYTLCDYI